MDGQDGMFLDWSARYARLLRRFARAYAESPADQEDLVQEMQFALWRSVPSYRGESSVTTWVYRVALQVALARRRTSRRRIRTEPLEAVPEPSAQTMVDGRLELRRAVEAIRQLPAVDRAVLVLALEGATPAESAEVLGISANATSVRLHRARRRLEAVLETGHGLHETTGTLATR